jgi:hypothetical protein
MLTKHFRSELFDDSVKVVRKHWETAARIFGSNVEIGGVVCDEGGLTKAIDNVFPNATRLLCSKHIKDNVTDHIKNKLPITKDQRSDIMSTLFGDNGIINADDALYIAVQASFHVRKECVVRKIRRVPMEEDWSQKYGIVSR